MSLISAHWLGPWRQHFDDELRLRQNHRKTNKSGFCIVSILCSHDVKMIILWVSLINLLRSLCVTFHFGGGGDIGIYGMAVLVYFSYGISVLSFPFLWRYYDIGNLEVNGICNFGLKNCGY